MKKSSERLLVFIVGVVFILIVLFLVFWKGTLTGDQRFVVRVVLSLAAGGFGALLPGAIGVDIAFVRATGAIALAVFVYWVNPPERFPRDPRPSHYGYLGALQDHLNQWVSADEFSLSLDSPSELRKFWIEPKVVGDDWEEVVAKICNRYSSCLDCSEGPDSLRMTIGLRGSLRMLSEEPLRYSCS